MKIVRLPALRSSILFMLAATWFASPVFSKRRNAPPPASRQYSNPVLFADYSDPDVIRDGNDFYLIASSFHFSPGLPILHSRDLVHWELSGHVLSRLNMDPKYDMKGGAMYGRGVWAPAVRFHAGRFYIYFPTPEEGIFVTTAPKMTGPWTEPVAVIAGPGWEDPCPFWDDDGNAYLIHSRLHAGPLILHRMSPDGMHVLDPGKVIVEDREHLPTLEGPKLYKRNGWYYIFAPEGGVGPGAQAVMRSRNIFGPYEHRIVLAQGATAVNGPHQGGYVETPDGRGWFLHFSLRGGHGRIVYLEPVRWENDWPIMGDAAPGATQGQPVATWPLPVVTSKANAMHPQTSDEFNERTLPPMWEWNHNPENDHWSLSERPGFLRLHTMPAADLLHARNTLTECMQDNSLDFTTRLELSHMQDDDRTGVSSFDRSVSYVAVTQKNGSRNLIFSINGIDTAGPPVTTAAIQLRAQVLGQVASYEYSMDDGRTFHAIGQPVTLAFSWWKGARPAIFAFHTAPASASSTTGGYVDVDWAHYRALPDTTPQP